MCPSPLRQTQFPYSRCGEYNLSLLLKGVEFRSLHSWALPRLVQRVYAPSNCSLENKSYLFLWTVKEKRGGEDASSFTRRSINGESEIDNHDLFQFWEGWLKPERCIISSTSWQNFHIIQLSNTCSMHGLSCLFNFQTFYRMYTNSKCQRLLNLTPDSWK